MKATLATPRPIHSLPAHALRPNRFSVSLYGDPASETEGLLESIRDRGILVPLVVVPEGEDTYEVLSGHRRLACASILELERVPCQVTKITKGEARRRAILDYNRHRCK